MEFEADYANYLLRVPFEVKACIAWIAIIWNYLFPNDFDDYIVGSICVALCFMLANVIYQRLTTGQFIEEEDFEDFFDD